MSSVLFRFHTVIDFTFQASTYASSDGVLTEAILDARVNEMIEQHRQKVDWLKEDSGENRSYLEPPNIKAT